MKIFWNLFRKPDNNLRPWILAVQKKGNKNFPEIGSLCMCKCL